MKRAAAVLLCLAVAASLWACDPTNLPTPVVPTATQAPADTATPDPPTATPTEAPPTPLPTVEPTLMPTEEPSATPNVEPDTPTPTVAVDPLPTDTPETSAGDPTRPPGPARTATAAAPTSDVPPPTAVVEEEPPSTGWSEVVRVPPGKGRVAVTFDAGASGEPWPRILAALRERNIRITMFITGKFAEQYPDAIRQAAADGHEIANHTYSHPDTRNISDEELIGELARTEAIIQDLTGVTSKPFWRPPYGARNNHVLNVAVAQGYRSIYWTLDSLDSVGQPKTPDFIFNRVTNPPNINLDGAIILQHFGSSASADALPRELDRFQEMGLRVVTVSELLSP